MRQIQRMNQDGMLVAELPLLIRSYKNLDFKKGRKASLFIRCSAVRIGNTDTGKDPCFVDIKSAAIIFDNFT